MMMMRRVVLIATIIGNGVVSFQPQQSSVGRGSVRSSREKSNLPVVTDPDTLNDAVVSQGSFALQDTYKIVKPLPCGSNYLDSLDTTAEFEADIFVEDDFAIAHNEVPTPPVSPLSNTIAELRLALDGLERRASRVLTAVRARHAARDLGNLEKQANHVLGVMRVRYAANRLAEVEAQANRILNSMRVRHAAKRLAEVEQQAEQVLKTLQQHKDSMARSMNHASVAAVERNVEPELVSKTNDKARRILNEAQLENAQPAQKFEPLLAQETAKEEEEPTLAKGAERDSILLARVQPKPVDEEKRLAEKYAKLSIKDRAYQILLDLGMIKQTTPEPATAF